MVLFNRIRILSRMATDKAVTLDQSLSGIGYLSHSRCLITLESFIGLVCVNSKTKNTYFIERKKTLEGERYRLQFKRSQLKMNGIEIEEKYREELVDKIRRKEAHRSTQVTTSPLTMDYDTPPSYSDDEAPTPYSAFSF